jgi:carboxymethylenebutenolidase
LTIYTYTAKKQYREGGKSVMTLMKALDDPALTYHDITFPNGDIAVDGYLVRPKSPAPAVIVTHGNAGLPEDMRNAAAQVAQAGFVGLLLDPTSRYPDLTQLSRDFLMSYAYLKLLLSDISAVINYLHQQSYVQASRVGLLGFCGGGILNIMYAAMHPDDVKAVVTFYAAPYTDPASNSSTDPRPHMISFVPQLKAPLQCHFGTEDDFAPPSAVEDFEHALRQYHVDAEVYIYEGAQHGFYHYTEPENYHVTASELALRRMQPFLKQHMSTK